MKWVIVSAVAFLYVLLFNEIATLYFDSDRKLSWVDVYRRFVPPTDFHIKL
jgi:hypothetical protein